jgi:hypothetical protein
MAEPSRITVPATLESLGRLRPSRARRQSARGRRPAAYGLSSRSDEIATNVVSYGYGPPHRRGWAAGRVGRLARGDARGLGTPFDPRTRELPGEKELSRPLEEREPGGLGILLAIQGVDRFDYRRVGDRNETVFEVRIGEGR